MAESLLAFLTEPVAFLAILLPPVRRVAVAEKPVPGGFAQPAKNKGGQHMTVLKGGGFRKSRHGSVGIWAFYLSTKYGDPGRELVRLVARSSGLTRLHQGLIL